ncbi:MAG: metallopeptidase family protein [Phycisphaerales bacterium]|nr:metallopeptidase family protein [Phycisphaerales bacterium]
MRERDRERFDGLLEEALENLPARLRKLLDEDVPLIVDDRPDEALARSLAREWGEEYSEEFRAGLCGLHTGIPLTERSVSHSGVMPTEIRIFREGILDLAGGFEAQDGESREDVDDAVYDEIMVTLLHEIGHHFGLGEDDLERLGYG